MSYFADIKLRLWYFRRKISIHTSSWIDLCRIKTSIYGITSLTASSIYVADHGTRSHSLLTRRRRGQQYPSRPRERYRRALFSQARSHRGGQDCSHLYAATRRNGRASTYKRGTTTISYPTVSPSRRRYPAAAVAAEAGEAAEVGEAVVAGEAAAGGAARHRVRDICRLSQNRQD
jgi:hypothetical protein